MKFYKTNILRFLVFLLLASCSSPDNKAFQDSIAIEITSFTTSKNKVDISWSIERFNSAIISSLSIYRYSTDSDADNSNRGQLIANLPSNETSFTDNDVPYLENLHYVIKINYFIENESGNEYFNVESDEAVFERNIVKLERVPNHIVQDQTNLDNYHFLTKSSNLDVFRYNMNTNAIEMDVTFEKGYNYLDKLIIKDENIFVGSIYGVINGLNTNDYSKTITYNLPIIDELKSFGFRDNEIHFNDKETWNCFKIDSGETIPVGSYYSTNFVFSIDLKDNKFLNISNHYPHFWATIYDISDFENIKKLYETDAVLNHTSYLDKSILHFKNDNSQFISTFYGRVLSIKDLSLLAELSKITGYQYYHFKYDNKGKLYGTVKNNKLIHVFNDETYELIETIKTKLYPVFPLISKDGSLQCIGDLNSYSLRHAIETF
ncbi:hypothetical protein NO995_08245 [Aestuariibaculum sp. M13]|uniref:hypothetical protein n=1 Tax=Aestuariibaculum sp. M13 TaxID=2967132 RepID=UPI002159F443|nr:hypothetical protein [Aestuariibaculum sp. M13]MCR8667669.1 hypothetical protein [Aestuariibaculum sp. M13]